MSMQFEVGETKHLSKLNKFFRSKGVRFR